jgi:hypothetical protein
MALRVLKSGVGIPGTPPQNTKLENANSKLDGAQLATRAASFDLRLSATPPPNTNNAIGHAGLGNYQGAPQPTNSGLGLSVISPHLNAQQLQFLLRVTPAALSSERTYEIPACVTIAQAILESATAAGWGSSVLFRLANNPFGIKYSHFVSALGEGDSKFKIQNSINQAPSCQSLAPAVEILNSGAAVPSAQPPASSAQSPAPRTQSPAPRTPSPESGAQAPESGAQAPAPSTQHRAPYLRRPRLKLTRLSTRRLGKSRTGRRRSSSRSLRGSVI